MNDQTLTQTLKSIGLYNTADTLSDIVATATKRRTPPRELIAQIANHETQYRKKKSLEQRTKRARLGGLAIMTDFDWNWPEKIDRASVDAALSLSFLDNAANVVLQGSHGLGKTMIAQNIANNAVLAGHSALFISASQLFNDLACQESPRALERKLRFYSQAIAVLCIDEIGYHSYENRAADLLYEIINRRHKKKSIVITTNLAFSDWPTVFPSTSCVAAMIDRLVERSSIIGVQGKSFRVRAAEVARETKTKKITSAAA